MISVITPTHDMKYLRETYDSLLGQTSNDWEWIVVPNGNARDMNLPLPYDVRVKKYPFQYDMDKVGALKRFACEKVQGDLVLELDHDDILLPTALEVLDRVAKAHPDVDFFYSNCAPTDLQNKKPHIYGENYGWVYRTMPFRDFFLSEVVAPEPLPQNLSRIWYAPDHFRAWRAGAYLTLGGHSQQMSVADDHDLVCRFYLQGKMHHIDECLYVYRVHGENTWLRRNGEVQAAMWQNHDKYIVPMMEKWSTERKLQLVDLCGAMNKPAGYRSMDLHNADIKGDLNKTWKLKDNSVGVLRGVDALEHLRDPIHVMNEAYRVLAHGGLFHVLVPSTSGKGAFRDPTHVSYWNDESFWYYTNRQYAQYIAPKYRGRFQVLRLHEWTSGSVVYAQADLISIKQDEPRFHGELLI